MKDYIKLDRGQLKRLEALKSKYRQFYDDPEHSSPMIVVNTPVENLPPWEERFDNPITMLQAELDAIRPHLLLEDDKLPTVRVQFGTAQVAAAFGCEMYFTPNNLPLAGTHVLQKAEDVYRMQKPALDAGWFGKVAAFTQVYLENLPEGIHIQQPDIQSPFNSAHLIRGNDILLDFFDAPEALDALLDLVTDYMIELVPHLNRMIHAENGWFYDWGYLWKGNARISNCTMHLISPDLYKTHVLPRDIRLMKALGGGRIHYCGTSGQVIDYFIKNPYITGLDCDGRHHDLWDLCRRMPVGMPLLYWWSNSPEEGQDAVVARLLEGDWPKKRNIILQVNAASLEEGRKLLSRLKASVPVQRS